MKNIQALAKQIKNLQTELDRADAAKARCLAAIEAAEVRAAELRGLQEQRTRIVAQAFADGGKPDTAAIDAEIAEYQKKHELEVQDGDAASSAIELLETRYAEYSDQLTTAREELTASVLDDLATRQAKAKDAFNTAIEAIGKPLEQLCALDAVERKLRGLGYSSLFEALTGNGISIIGERGIMPPEWFGHVRQSDDGYRALADELRALGLTV